ncbi:MAG TPA: hypothetical protein VF623_15540, partial [Segetibacter sp.]
MAKFIKVIGLIIIAIHQNITSKKIICFKAVLKVKTATQFPRGSATSFSNKNLSSVKDCCMYTIGLIREGKTLPDNRVALTPAQCKWMQSNYSDIKILVQPCNHRCFTNHEYVRAGIEVNENLDACDLLLGIKEVPVAQLIPAKKYMFFSHTKKQQPH